MKTTEELHNIIQAGNDAISKAKAAAEKAAQAKVAAAEEARAELQQREQDEASRIQAREYHWGHWYIHGGGYDQARSAARTESTEARAALEKAVRENPVTAAAIRYLAAGESQGHIIDLRQKALAAIGEEETMHHAVNGRENRNDPTREILAAINDAANNVSAEHWEDLVNAVEQSIQAHDEAWPETMPTGEEAAKEEAVTEASFRKRPRIEEYELQARDGSIHRVLHDLDTGETYTLDGNLDDVEEAES